MPQAIAGVVSSVLTSVGVSAAVAATIATAVGNLVVGAVVQLASNALTKRRTPSREELKRELSTPTERPPYRFVYGKTRATGSLVSWPVKGSILWGCWLLNSRSSDLGDLKLFLDNREVTYTGDPFDFADEDGAVADTAPFLNHVNFWVSDGSETTPPVRFTDDLPYDPLDPEFYKTTDGWQGRTVIWMRLDAGANAERSSRWPSVPPLVEVEAKWSKLYDPRNVAHDINDVSTHEFDDNQALIALDALLHNPMRPFQESNINIDTFEWAADVADEAVDLKAGGTEPRYTAAGTIVFSEGVEIEDALDPILIAGASKLARIAGKLGIIPATLKTSSATVTDVIDNLSVEWTKPIKDIPTLVLGSYVSVTRGYEDADLPPYTIPGAQAADGGIPKTKSLRMSMVQSATQAQRIVKIMAYDGRRQRQIKTILPPDHMNITAGAEVTLDLGDDFAALDGDYEVVSTLPDIRVDQKTGGVKFRSEVTLLITDDTGLAWDKDVDEVDIFDEDFDPGVGDVQMPGIIGVNVIEVDNGDSVVPRLRFEFDPSTTASVYSYKWEWREEGDLDWTEGGHIDATNEDADGDVYGYFDFISIIKSYDLRVQAWSPHGVSDWREKLGLDLGFINTGVALTGGMASVNATGTAPDLSSVSGVRLYSADVGEVFANATQVGDQITVFKNSAFDVDFGDATATNVISNGGFDDGTDWTAGTGWTIASGVASHTSGNTPSLDQTLALTEGDTYRVTFDLANRTAGSVSVDLVGTTTTAGTDENSNGTHESEIVVPASMTDVIIKSNSAFDGDVDNLYLVKDSVDALPQGEKDFWIVPVTNTGSEGTPSGPYTLRVY